MRQIRMGESDPQVTIRSPSVEIATACAPDEGAVKVRATEPSDTRQTLADVPPRPISSVPSGENVGWEVSSDEDANVRTSPPSLARWSRRPTFAMPMATNCPSGENARDG